MAQESISLGQYLQKERENKNFSREYVSQNIRIRPPFIQALEEDDFQVLPAEPYARGFIRSYCHFMGLNPQEALEIYRQQVEPAVPEVVEEKAEKVITLHSVKNHLFDFLATIVGGAPAYSLNKSFLRPKE